MAIAVFLQSVKPVSNRVPDPFKPGDTGSTSMMRIIPPGGTAAAAPNRPETGLPPDVVFGDHYIPHDGDRESLWEGADETRAVETTARLKSRELAVNS